jgi:ribosomal protein S21
VSDNRTPLENKNPFRYTSIKKMKLKKNIKAPNFKLASTDKKIFELKKIRKKNIILYFYPKDDTPGCTIESKDFSKLNNLISKNNSIVFGISKDSIESHLKFKKKYKLKFNLLSDEKLLVIKIEVKDNNVDQALRVLKRKLQREGFFKILKVKSNYEKPSERKKRERQENIKRSKKLQRMRNNI